jgi:4-amino-4-deoxy-L-arabinose transferase-like glycosyltransferase
MRFLDSRCAVYWILGLGLLIRIAPLMMVGGKVLAHENPSYDRMALQLMNHVNFSPYWPPGLPYYLAFFHKAFGPGMLVARASMLVIYGAFSVMLYVLVRELSSRWAANLAVLTFAVYPSYVRYAFNPSTEYPTAFCLLAVAYLTLHIVRNPYYWEAALLGVSLAVLALVRSNSVGLAVIAPTYILMRTKKWGIALVSLLISSVVIGAWLGRAYELAGHFVLINDSNEENFVFANHPDTPLKVTCRDCPEEWHVPASFLRLEREIDYKPSAERQHVLRDATLHYVLARPDLFVVRILIRFCAYFTFPIHYADPLVHHNEASALMRRWTGALITFAEVCFFWPIMILAVIFCFNLPRFPEVREGVLAMLGIAGVYAIPCWLTWSQARYAFPVIPVFAVFAFVLVNAVREKRWREILRPVLISTRRRTAMLLALALFGYIQVEWILLVVSSNTWQQPIQRTAVLLLVPGNILTRTTV